MKRKTELLLPAGGPETLREAVYYGADAVYIGGTNFSLREKADNATADELSECVRFSHEHGVKLYVAVNIFAHNKDLPEMRKYLTELREIRPDGLIISDPGVFSMAKETAPELDIHISTQANNVNYETYRFWHELGAKRVVSGRELSLRELREIREKIPEEMEIEAFVHGAMCISYSGRCLLSNYLTGRDANLGQCTHPCRWKYALMEEKRPGEYFPVFEDDRGTYIMNSKDLCMIAHLPEMIEAGVSSLKVEGRMKTILYVATVARAYRAALRDYEISEELYRENIPKYLTEIGKCTNREFTTGFFFGKPDTSAQLYEGEKYTSDAVFIGNVLKIDENGDAVFLQRNKFVPGDRLEIMKKDGTNVETVAETIRDEQGELLLDAREASKMLHVRFSVMPEPYEVIRKVHQKKETK